MTHTDQKPDIRCPECGNRVARKQLNYTMGEKSNGKNRLPTMYFNPSQIVCCGRIYDCDLGEWVTNITNCADFI